MSVAARVAEEMGVKLGNEVSCSIGHNYIEQTKLLCYTECSNTIHT